MDVVRLIVLHEAVFVALFSLLLSLDDLFLADVDHGLFCLYKHFLLLLFLVY